MRAPADRVVRPTFRCLVEDLGDEVGPSELRSVLQELQRNLDSDPHYLLPVALVAAEHLVLDKANMLALDASAARESIETITDRVAVKVKTSNRRAALWQDQDGVWWLLAAGFRKNDSPGDFYRTLERFEGDSRPIAPSDLDARYLKFESAYLADWESERAAQAAVVRALLAAAAHPGVTQQVEVFGAVLAISVQSEDDVEMLSVSFDFTNFEHAGRFPADILAFVPGYESLDDWDILPPLRPGDPQCWFTYVQPRWVEWLATAVELDELLGREWTPPSPSAPASSQRAHRATATVITISYIEGVEITALCGARFTAHRDPHRFEECPDCTAALSALRSGRQH